MYKRTWTWTCNLCAWLCPLVHVSVSSSGSMLGCLSMGLHAFLCGVCAGVLCMCAFAAMPVCVDLCAFLPFCIYLVLSLPLCAFVRGVHVYVPVCPSLSVCAYVKCVCSACMLACLHVRWALLPHTMPKTCNSAGPGKVYGGPRLPCLGIAGPWAWPWEARRASRGGHCRPGPSRCRLLTGPCPLGCQWEAARNPTRWAWCAPMAS